MSKSHRYADNWPEIALAVKETAEWRCAKCARQCLRPGELTKGLSKSERTKFTLTVHHQNRIPEDNSLENLIALCTTCHLYCHTRSQSNIPPGQLSLCFD